jgi:hypothetical protein
MRVLGKVFEGKDKSLDAEGAKDNAKVAKEGNHLVGMMIAQEAWR